MTMTNKINSDKEKTACNKTTEKDPAVSEILVSAEQLDEVVTRMANEIDRDYDTQKKLLLLVILKGAVVFATELMKKIRRPVEIDFMRASSYRGTVSSGNVNILLDIDRNDISSLDILIVEDIVDSGRTMSRLTSHLKSKGASSVKVATLLDKPSRREVEFKADYVGITIDDHFVIGYGVDYDEKYRQRPYIGILDPRFYKNS